MVAVIGLLLNILVLYLLKHGEADLNRRAAILHVMADLLASITALGSGIIIILLAGVLSTLYCHWSLSFLFYIQLIAC